MAAGTCGCAATMAPFLLPVTALQVRLPASCMKRAYIYAEEIGCPPSIRAQITAAFDLALLCTQKQARRLEALSEAMTGHSGLQLC